jgi:hypothetical protein
MIDISLDINHLDAIVRVWLKDTIQTIEINEQREYVHPDDAETYAKDKQALKRVLSYIGEHP